MYYGYGWWNNIALMKISPPDGGMPESTTICFIVSYWDNPLKEVIGTSKTFHWLLSGCIVSEPSSTPGIRTIFNVIWDIVAVQNDI